MFSTRLFSAFASKSDKVDASDSIPSEWAATCCGPRDAPSESELRQRANGTSHEFAATAPMGLPAA